jgi:Fission yeast centromere protein N-terminal domain
VSHSFARRNFPGVEFVYTKGRQIPCKYIDQSTIAYNCRIIYFEPVITSIHLEIWRLSSKLILLLKKSKLLQQSRRTIRRRAAYPGKRKEFAEWFEQETGRHLVQGKISEILSSKYQYLDDDKRKDRALDSQRHSVADHADLEGALLNGNKRYRKRKDMCLKLRHMIFGLLCLKRKTWRSPNGHPDS